MSDVTLRPVQAEDLPWLWHWQHEDEAREWQHWDAPYFARGERMGLDEFVGASQSMVEHGHRRLICPAEGGVAGGPLGIVTRWEEDPTGGGWWELGIVIFDPQHWGQGFGCAALREWTTQTFADTNAHVITLTTWSGNERMVASGIRAGYAECARIPEARSWKGRRYDSVKLAVLRHDWTARQRQLS